MPTSRASRPGDEFGFAITAARTRQSSGVRGRKQGGGESRNGPSKSPVEDSPRRMRIRRLTRFAFSAARDTRTVSPSRPCKDIPKRTHAPRTPSTSANWSSTSAPCAGPITGISSWTWSTPKTRGFVRISDPSQKPIRFQWPNRAQIAVRSRPTRVAISGVVIRGSVPHQDHTPPGYIHRKMRRSKSSTWASCLFGLKPAVVPAHPGAASIRPRHSDQCETRNERQPREGFEPSACSLPRSRSTS